jgi:acyl-CoA hydrolase
MTVGRRRTPPPRATAASARTPSSSAPGVRDAVRDGRADFSPVFLSEIPHLLKSSRLPVDAALIQTSPPDAHGMVSLGVSVDIVRAAVDSARLILAEINPRMPRTPGDTLLDIRRCKHVVAVDAPLPEHEPVVFTDVSRAIGELVSDLVPDAATLQVGIGELPRAVLSSLRNHRDLGIHTEMLSDGVMELVKLGVVNGLRKTLAPGKMVASFLLGSEALYRWAHENPELEMRGSDWVNDPYVISQNMRMVSINTALAVDPHRSGRPRTRSTAASTRASADRWTSSAAPRAAPAAGRSSSSPRSPAAGR